MKQTALPGGGSKYYLSSADLVFLLISMGLIALNITRMENVPLTFDECAPHAEAVRPYLKILSFEVPSSNDHLLNSVLRKFFLDIFPDTPFWRRFDNLLAQMLFLWYSRLLSKKLFSNNLWQLCVFFLLNLQPFMFQFWGLSRGYGLSIALMISSLYYVVCYNEHRKLLHLNLALYLAALAVYAHVVLLDYYWALLGAIIVLHLLPGKQVRDLRQIRKTTACILAACGVLALMVASPIQKLVASKQLYFGGDTDMVNDTLKTLVKANMAVNNEALTTTVIALIIAGFAAQTIYWTTLLLRKKLTNESCTGFILWLLVVIPVAVVIAQYYLLHTLYPQDRVALFFLPLYLLSFCYWLRHITYETRWTGNILIVLLALLSACNFLKDINLTSTRNWWYGQYDVLVLERVIN